MQRKYTPLNKSTSYKGEFFSREIMVNGRLSEYIIYFIPCGALPIGEYIQGTLSGEIRRVDGVNYKLSREHSISRNSFISGK